MKVSWRSLLKIGLPVLAFTLAMLIYPHMNNRMKLSDEVRQHPLFSVYEEHYDNKALMGGICDLNSDGLDDIIVVFSVDKDQNQCVVILAGDPPIITPPERAPLEDVTIEFKDIDQTPPMEFILAGSKSGNIGYAICRIKEDVIYSLFDADMDHCC